MKLMLRNVRLSFPNIWRPDVVKGRQGEKEGKPTYNCNVLIPHADPQIALINKAIEDVVADKWKEKAPLMLQEIRAKDRVPLHNGDFKADYDGYAGMYFLTARSETKPLIVGLVPWQVDDNGQPMRDAKGKLIPNELQETDGRPYGGCYVNLNIDIYAYTKPVNGVTAGLKGIQFVGDGDAFAGGPPADPEEFDDLSAPAGAGPDLSSMM